MTWNTGFDNSPSGSDFGNVMCKALRDLEEAFKERLGQDHVFDEGGTPQCHHKAGLCTVVQITEETSPASNLVEGALQFNDTSGLFRDTGAGMECVGPASHLGLGGVGDWEEDHPQYIPVNPVDGYVEVSGNINMGGSKVTGLPESLSGSETDYFVLSYGMHIGEDVAGGAKHANSVVSTSRTFSDGIPLGLDKFKFTYMSGALSGEITLSDYATLPLPAGADGWGFLGAHKDGIAPNDYVGRIYMGLSRTMYWVRFDA